MTMTFQNDNDVIIYPLEKIISFAKENQQIYVAQYIWWLASVIGLESGLITYIDNFKGSVSNGSGPSLRVRVRVQTERFQNWRYGSSINPNCPLGYSSTLNSQPV